MCQWLSVAYSFLLGMGNSCSLPPVNVAIHFIEHVQVVCAAIVSVSSYVSQEYVWKILFTWNHPSLLALIIIQFLCYIEPWALRGVLWWRHSIWEWVIEDSYSLHIVKLLVSMLILIALRRSVFNGSGVRHKFMDSMDLVECN